MRRNRVFMNLEWVIAMSIWLAVVTTAILAIVFTPAPGESKARIDATDITLIVLLFSVYIVILISFIPKWFGRMEFSENGLYVCKPFKKKFFIEYSKIHQITMATYDHTGFHPAYIVITTRKLSPYEHTHINLVNDDNVVILRKRKKVLKLLKTYQLTIKQ